MSNSKPVRALALPNNNIGQQRNILFRRVLSRVNHARQDGYYLEAITLLESLISDRLESYLSFIKGENSTFYTLGGLIENFKNKALQDKIDSDLKDIIFNEVDNWRQQRNIVLHQMAKIDFNNQLTWEQKCQDLDKITEDGLIIFRKIDKRLSALRKLEN